MDKNQKVNSLNGTASSDITKEFLQKRRQELESERQRGLLLVQNTNINVLRIEGALAFNEEMMKKLDSFPENAKV